MRVRPAIFDDLPGIELISAPVVFMCADPYEPDLKMRCETFDASSGANAVVLLQDVQPVEPTGEARFDPHVLRWVEVPEFFMEPNFDVD